MIHSIIWLESRNKKSSKNRTKWSITSTLG